MTLGLDTDLFILYNIIMIGIGWYLHKTHGEAQFKAGIIEGAILHSEGKLTYKSYFEGEGIEMIDITIKDED